jgi:hypothetical protein
MVARQPIDITTKKVLSSTVESIHAAVEIPGTTHVAAIPSFLPFHLFCHSVSNLVLGRE